MNYGLTEIKKKREGLDAKAPGFPSGARTFAIYGIIAIVLALILVFTFAVIGAFRGVVDNAPDAAEFDFLASGSPSVLYDSRDERMQTLGDEDLDQEFVSFDRIPDCVVQAFLVIQDKRFFEHHGIDMTGLIQSLYASVTGENYSEETLTITQQLIQNQILDYRTPTTILERVAREIQLQYLAVETEDSYDKSQILEYYLNTINIGDNIMGVQAAARRYFDKDIDQINLSEAALLAATAVDPALYNPVTDRESNLEMCREVLKGMLDEKYITEAEYEDALGQDVYTKIQNVNSEPYGAGTGADTYYADAVVTQAIADLRQNLNLTQTQAYNMLYRGGLKVYTCMDLQIQDICDEVVNTQEYYPQKSSSYLSYRLVVEKDGQKTEYTEMDMKNFFLEEYDTEISLYMKNKDKAQDYISTFRLAMTLDGASVEEENLQFIAQPQTSFVLMEQSTGKVLAIVGGRGEKSENNNVNRATELNCQPGMALSVFSAYAPALDTAGLTLGDVVDDANYYNAQIADFTGYLNQESYTGLLSLREALVQEKEIPAVKTLDKISVQTGFSYLKKFGFSSVIESAVKEDGSVETDMSLKAAVGSLSEGVTNLELTAAYAALANGGTYTEPKFYTKIEDSAGDTVWEEQESTKTVVKKSTAWLLTDALSQNMTVGSANKANLGLVNLPCAGCMGTSFDNSGGFFVGYTPYYTAGIWSGQDESGDGNDVGDLTEMWRQIMRQVHIQKGETSGSFTTPDNLVTCLVCEKCGNLAVSGLCDMAQGGSAVVTETYEKGTEPTTNCTCHVRYAFCTQSQKLAGENCPESAVEYRVLLDKEEETQTDDTKNTVATNTAVGECTLHHKEIKQ